MLGHLAHTAGSPCPTLVLDARDLPADENARCGALAGIRRRLEQAGGGHVLKIALIEPSRRPGFDLDYRFVQALPGGPDKFDLRGSCGHSVLAAIVAAAESGMLARLVPRRRIGVQVLNNGDHLVCQIGQITRSTVELTVHFRFSPPRPTSSLLLTGEPQTTLTVAGQRVSVSLVSAGNPYAFVGPSSVGVTSRGELFADDPALFDRLVTIRHAAAMLLGWPVEGAFPKVAVTMPTSPGRIAVRAVSVPSWHPTLALTGAACLAAATCIVHTIPWLAARQAGAIGGTIGLDTPGDRSAVTVITRSRDRQSELTWITAGRRQVTFLGSFRWQPRGDVQPGGIAECLSRSA
jgi:2-methylaconitate cis-trans-isomerase PrpF